MPLATEVKQQFGSKDRSRGASYFRYGRVRQMVVNGDVISANVNGSYGYYEVTINLEDLDDQWGMDCTCPRFSGGYPCKHIWAVVLEFDKRHGGLITSQAHSRRTIGTAESRKEKKTAKKARPPWQSLLSRAGVGGLSQQLDNLSSESGALHSGTDTELLYVIDVSNVDHESSKMNLMVLRRKRRKDDSWGMPTEYKLSRDEINILRDSNDQRIASQLLGADRSYQQTYYYQPPPNRFSEFQVDPFWSEALSKTLVSSGRFFWALNLNLDIDEYHPISSVDLSGDAVIALEVEDEPGSKSSSSFSVKIKANGQTIDNSDVVMISSDGVVLLTDRLLRLSNSQAVQLWRYAQHMPKLQIKENERQSFLGQLAQKNLMTSIQLPESWEVREVDDVPLTPVLKLLEKPSYGRSLGCYVSFAYDNVDEEVGLKTRQQALYDSTNNTWFQRDQAAESTRVAELMAFPVAQNGGNRMTDCDFFIHPKNLVDLVDQQGSNGWVIHLQGERVRQSASFDVAIESGQDWFDLSANVDFDGDSIPLPMLLQAVARKESFVMLANGDRGRIPEEFVKKYGPLAEFGQVQDDKIRFRVSQAMILDAMLDAREVKTDARFRRVNKKLKSFDGIKPKKAPRSFQGTLRDYQTEGLSWLHFLRDFQLGGCLADDMGLGKTIQVLSLLEQRRTRRVAPTSKAAETKPGKLPLSLPDTTSKKAGSKTTGLVTAAAVGPRKPSIVIVPKSLIFNWIEEAARFTPKLRFLNYTGTARGQAVDAAIEAGGFDVLITTYGTMRKDIGDLSQIEFDYAILDESQAIKNAKAQCSKACRLLQADHRLAMTGTPIENHLGELWSLFEFLNPGMLGSSAGFSRLTRQSKSNEQQREETLSRLSQALKPYLLRRTKEQVLTELPPKTEQTLYCDMTPSQKKAYKSLKEYYRVKLKKKVATVGIGRAKIQVLEALLRLRQVACDPRLVDGKAKEGAKLELLQQQVTDVLAEGHKVLIFSQFTSLLALVKKQFDKAGINYEYLDGQSRKRAASVKRFQEDSSVQAFLISIKAGGHGLNLTAADYVFLLDPWWNPAVEAQAIDRAHRMGQSNPVIAYRMVCRDTVEEKIIELQKSKRELAEKIVRSDESLIRSLSVDDLQMIFS